MARKRRQATLDPRYQNSHISTALDRGRNVGYKTAKRHCKNPECNRLFKASRSDQIYCCEECRKNSFICRRRQRDRKPIGARAKDIIGEIDWQKCHECAKVYPRLCGNAKYCSDKCYQSARKAQMRERYARLRQPLLAPDLSHLEPDL